ncbi:MAG: hypothetical protein OXH60_02880 [Rhodospirillales bacterium]|nr:hypothetical protein [Rhodospirillales bacterium]
MNPFPVLAMVEQFGLIDGIFAFGIIALGIWVHRLKMSQVRHDERIKALQDQMTEVKAMPAVRQGKSDP